MSSLHPPIYCRNAVLISVHHLSRESQLRITDKLSGESGVRITTQSNTDPLFMAQHLFETHSETKPLSNHKNLTSSYLKRTIMIIFRHPTTILMAAHTHAGKTVLFKQVLEHQHIQPAASLIIFVHGEQAPDLADLKHLNPPIEDVQGMKVILDVRPRISSG